VEVVIDRSIIEVFLDGGTRSGTQTFFSTDPLTKPVVTAGGVKYGMEINVEIQAIQSAWTQYEDESGLVVGNKTSSGGMAKRYMRYDASFSNQQRKGEKTWEFKKGYHVNFINLIIKSFLFYRLSLSLFEDYRRYGRNRCRRSLIFGLYRRRWIQPVLLCSFSFDF
jgi:hypothetical protein